MQSTDNNNDTARNIWLSYENFALAAFEANTPSQKENEEIVTAALDHHKNKTRQKSNAVPAVLLPIPTIN